MSDFFNSASPVITTEAPGRMDVMGGISDYSGSLLLQMPIKQTTTVQAQVRDDRHIVIRSVESKTKADHFSITTDELAHKSYSEIATYLRNQKGGDWAAYVVGCIVVLHKEKNTPLKGLNISISSTVPVGKGVSSSAALEVSVCCALSKIYELTLSETELPLLAQKAENLVVGAPCGLMDQLSSYLGQKNKLLPLVCQPHTVFNAINIPTGISFTAIDSGIRHAVSGASYSDVRAAAFMAYTIIANNFGATTDSLANARETNNWIDLPFKGFLANISPSVFEQRFKEILPEQLSGREFLEQYAVSIDKVTQIHPDKVYRLRSCAQHPVYENFRIQSFMNLLVNFSRQKDKIKSMQLLGEMMFQSHASYSSVGLGNSHIDDIVQRVREAGVGSGLFGARITGGGSGGTVCVMSYGADGKKNAQSIFDAYRKSQNIKSFFFTGSTDGARKLNN